MIVTLIGSTRDKAHFERVMLEESLAGNVVLTVACFMHADAIKLSENELLTLREVHRAKIRMADEVLVLNVGGYIGDSTRQEIDYSQSLGKPVRFLEELPPIEFDKCPDGKPCRNPTTGCLKGQCLGRVDQSSTFGPIEDRYFASDAIAHHLKMVLHALLDRDITFDGRNAILLFESHDQAMNHIAEARRAAK